MNRLISVISVAVLLAAQLIVTTASAQGCPAPGESGIIGVFEGDSVGAGVAYLQVEPAPTATFTIPDCGFTAVFVEARWDAFVDDVDLYLLDEEGAELGNSQAIQAGQAANIQGTELVVLSQPDAGIYNAELRGWTSSGASSYTITVMGTVPGGGGGGGDLSTDAGRDDVVVIAVVDSGINPYHWDYLASRMPQHKDSNTQNDLPLSDDPATWLPGHPGADAFASYTKLELQLEEEDSSASSSELHDDDIAQWSKIRYSEGTLNDQVHMYWFPGTKIVGHVAFPGALVGDPATSAVIGQSSGNIDTWAYDSHGIGTSTVAVGNIHGSCPECVLVYVHGTSEEANQWVAKQDWIDLQSNSWGLSLTGAARDRIYAGSDTELQRRATERGQPHFFSAGNGLENAFVTPNPTLFSSQEGPDWIVTVGAIETDGSSPGHGRPSDISSIGGGYPSGNGSEGTDGSIIDDSVTATSGFGGTSNATPVVAGMYGEALHKLRRALPGASRVQSGGVIAAGDASCGSANDQCALADGVLTVHELLEALYRGAEYTGTGHNVGGLATIPASGNAQELQYMAMGHGAYFGKMLGPQQYEVEVAKIVGYALGQWTETPSAEDAAWYVADSICRQAIWGPWAHGYATESSAVEIDPQWPVRSFLAQGCPEVLPSVVEAEKLYASQFRELDSSADDSDDDGVENSKDNCPDTRNSNQADADGDSQGDACQPAPTNTAPVSSLSANLMEVTEGDLIIFSVAVTDNEGDDFQFTLDFGDGTDPATGSSNTQVQHRYLVAGNYRAVLNVEETDTTPVLAGDPQELSIVVKEKPSSTVFPISENSDLSELSLSIASNNVDLAVAVWLDQERISTRRLDRFGRPVGPETLVYESIGDVVPEFVRNAMAPSGEYIIAWKTLNRETFDSALYFQRYDEQGEPEAEAVLLESRDASAPVNNLSISMRDDGTAVIVWERSAGVIKAAIVPADSAAVPQSFVVASGTLPLFRKQGATTWLQDGSFILGWSDRHDVYVSRYSDAGALLQNSRIGFEEPNYSEKAPLLAQLSDGGLVAVFSAADPFGSGVQHNLYLQRLAPDLVASESPVRIDTVNNDYLPADYDAVVYPNNEMAVLWSNQRKHSSNSDLPSFQTLIRRVRVGPTLSFFGEALLSSAEMNSTHDVNIEGLAGGSAMVGWTSFGPGGGADISDVLGQYLSESATRGESESAGGDNGTLDAELSVTPGADNFTFTFDASASHYEEGGTLNQPMYRFAFGDGETTPPQSAATISHSYTAAGTYRAFVVVSDANGNSAISEEQSVEVIIVISVTDGSENAARLTVDRATGAAPLRVTFDATGSTTADGFSISNYAWDFDGDGTVDLSGSNGVVQHVYTEAGNYTPEVTVTFTDDADAQNTETSVAKATVAATNNATPVAPSQKAGGGALGTLLLLPLLGFAAIRRRKQLH